MKKEKPMPLLKRTILKEMTTLYLAERYLIIHTGMTRKNRLQNTIRPKTILSREKKKVNKSSYVSIYKNSWKKKSQNG